MQGHHSLWKYPNIPGIDKFQGKLMHSANWDTSCDLKDKTVAVIGGGSSAVQIIPSIQPTVKKLVPYVRSPAWITSGFGAKYAAPGGVNFTCMYLALNHERRARLTDDCRFRKPEGNVQKTPRGTKQILPRRGG
jgi:cation diffusion facilitator CzcD-associated flavoprotein CzcO